MRVCDMCGTTLSGLGNLVNMYEVTFHRCGVYSMGVDDGFTADLCVECGMKIRERLARGRKDNEEVSNR